MDATSALAISHKRHEGGLLASNGMSAEGKLLPTADCRLPVGHVAATLVRPARSFFFFFFCIFLVSFWCPLRAQMKEMSRFFEEFAQWRIIKGDMPLADNSTMYAITWVWSNC
jgi:hypothetical protein